MVSLSNTNTSALPTSYLSKEADESAEHENEGDSKKIYFSTDSANSASWPGRKLMKAGSSDSDR